MSSSKRRNSQGKTRIKNPVDLSSARSHQSYYTALSRSATAAGTVILQGFDTYKITGGASGALRQEFRELEMLDDITTLRYNGKLSSSSKVHRAIRWKENDPFSLSEGTDVAWRIVDSSDKLDPGAGSKKQSVSNVVQTDRTPLLGKRRLGADFESEASEASNPSKTGSNTTEHHAPIGNPRGLQWSNNSCAFDAVLSVLFNIWQDNTKTRLRCSEYTLEDVRDFLRQRLQRADPTTFPWGGYTGTPYILDYLLSTDHSDRL